MTCLCFQLALVCLISVGAAAASLLGEDAEDHHHDHHQLEAEHHEHHEDADLEAGDDREGRDGFNR